MLESLFGNRTAEKVLLFIERYGHGYPSDIANTFDTRVHGIQRQLKRLENGGIISSRLYGKVRIYQYNPRYPFLKELRALLDKAIAFLPPEDIKKFYSKRTRPRKQGKPI
jgi:hypothetical protein